jgi:hypothetical protein
LKNFIDDNLSLRLIIAALLVALFFPVLIPTLEEICDEDYVDLEFETRCI